MKLISLIGARPQIIKEAILNQEFERRNRRNPGSFWTTL